MGRPDTPSLKRHHPPTPRRRLTDYTSEACPASIDLPQGFGFTVYVHVILTGKLSFLLIFFKNSLSNVSRTNFLPLRSGQKEVVSYPEAFSSQHSLLFASVLRPVLQTMGDFGGYIKFLFSLKNNNN